MKVTILNGNADMGNTSLDTYLAELSTLLMAKGCTVSHFTLREMDLRYCVGCFGCWVKTPGECITPDDGPKILDEIIHSDFLLWAAPMKMGFPSAMLKKIMDKSIPLLHPYFVVENNEAHHRARYDRYPRVGLVIQPENDTDSRDIELVTDIFSRTALNMKSRLEFVQQIESTAGELADKILNPVDSQPLYTHRLAATCGAPIQPPTHLTLFNGSPRGQKGNTPLLFQHLQNGFTSLPGRSVESFNLLQTKKGAQFRDAFAAAECVLLGFPLYTDSMPGIVKAFIEELEPLRGRPGNPPLGFLIQSGFPESAHSRHIERYLEKLAGRMGSTYLGTIVKGGAEGIQIMPKNMTAKLFTAMSQIGKTLAETGQLDPELLRSLAKPERYAPVLGPVIKLFLKLPVASFYWDGQLKKNGAYEQRFKRPYETQA